MVYRGLPSKACKECRGRRLKCDLIPTGCGQCARAQLTCSGYRDVSQLRLNNQTEKVIAKFQKNTKQTIPQHIGISIELRAQNLFFSNYVFGNSAAFDYLQEFYPHMYTEEHLSLGIDAASLAYYSTQIHCPEALKKARAIYGMALTRTNASLQSPVSAAKDSTLLTVLLLDLFDKLMDRNPQDFQSWTNHMTGALALIRLRGPDQFRSNIGLRMFVQFSATLVINCMMLEVLVPRELMSLRAYAGQFLDVDDPKWHFADLMIRFVELRVAARDRTWSDQEAMERAEQLETDLALLSMKMLSIWRYDTICVDAACKDVYDRYFHVYPNHNVAHVWNIVRLTRIFLNETIYQYRTSTSESISVLPAAYADPGVQSVVDTIMELAAEICASVPQYVTLPLQQPKLPQTKSYQSTETDNSSVSDSQPYTTFPSSRCYSLLYPLYVAGQSRNSSAKLKPWVIKQLKFIADTFGIKNAQTVAGILEQDETINPWSVYALIGSNAFAA